jgi:hypothetical protein
MKKSIIVVLFTVFLFIYVASPILAAETCPIQEISGIMIDIKVKIPESAWVNGFTIIEFKDGRTMVFDGIYTGLVFEKNKECKITYCFVDVPFTRGYFIKNIEYKKK